jgi:hypothetical protein
MPRHTIAIDQVRRWVNHLLATPDSSHTGLSNLTPEQAFRLGAATLLEQMLHTTGTYAGYREDNDGDRTRRTYFTPRPAPTRKDTTS